MALAQSALRAPATPKKIGAGTTDIRKLIIGGELMRV
jgi:hypothetical protein